VSCSRRILCAVVDGADERGRRAMIASIQSPATLLLTSARLMSDNGANVSVLSGAGASFAQWRDASDWDKGLAMAAAHGMRPLLYPFLNDSAIAAIPDRVIATLQEFTRQNLRKNLGMTGELILLLRLFAERGVNVIPFKGPTLAALAYSDLGLREFGDLDLLIARLDFMEAQELLIAQGYQPEILLNAS